jgi:hypothetical protein
MQFISSLDLNCRLLAFGGTLFLYPISHVTGSAHVSTTLSCNDLGACVDPVLG